MNTESYDLVTDAQGAIDTQYYLDRARELRAQYIRSALARLFRPARTPRTRFLSTTHLVLGQPA